MSEFEEAAQLGETFCPMACMICIIVISQTHAHIVASEVPVNWFAIPAFIVLWQEDDSWAMVFVSADCCAEVQMGSP